MDKGVKKVPRAYQEVAAITAMKNGFAESA
jgi:hypothetical protein